MLSARWRTIARPRPVPPWRGCAPCPPGRSARRSGAGARPAMPGPSSRTSRAARPPSVLQRRTSTLPSRRACTSRRCRRGSPGSGAAVRSRSRLRADPASSRGDASLAWTRRGCPARRRTSWRRSPGRHALPARRALPRLEAGQLEQVSHQRRHPLGVDRILPRNRCGFAGSFSAPSSSASTNAADRRERSAQLVGRVGHEVAADLLHAASVGDVVEGDHGAVRGALHRRGKGPPTSDVAPGGGALTWTSASRRSPGAQDLLDQRRRPRAAGPPPGSDGPRGGGGRARGAGSRWPGARSPVVHAPAAPRPSTKGWRRRARARARPRSSRSCSLLRRLVRGSAPARRSRPAGRRATAPRGRRRRTGARSP